MSTPGVVIGLSWSVSAVLLIHLWKGREPLFFKIAFTLILVVPLLGPFMYWWIQSMPPSQSRDLQDYISQGNVLRRWRSRLEAGGYAAPLRRWGDRKKK